MTLIQCLDDDEAHLNLLGLVFELAGYDHLRTHDNVEALSLLRIQPIDLFTQDLLRPNMSGVEFYRVMKSDDALRHIPVLILSAAAGFPPGFVAECRSVYGDEYLSKPWGPSELVTTVAELLARRGKHVLTDEERADRKELVRAKYAPGATSGERFDELWERADTWLNKP